MVKALVQCENRWRHYCVALLFERLFALIEFFENLGFLKPCYFPCNVIQCIIFPLFDKCLICSGIFIFFLPIRIKNRFVTFDNFSVVCLAKNSLVLLNHHINLKKNCNSTDSKQKIIFYRIFIVIYLRNLADNLFIFFLTFF